MADLLHFFSWPLRSQILIGSAPASSSKVLSEADVYQFVRRLLFLTHFSLVITSWRVGDLEKAIFNVYAFIVFKWAEWRYACANVSIFFFTLFTLRGYLYFWNYFFLRRLCVCMCYAYLFKLRMFYFMYCAQCIFCVYHIALLHFLF